MPHPAQNLDVSGLSEWQVGHLMAIPGPLILLGPRVPINEQPVNGIALGYPQG